MIEAIRYYSPHTLFGMIAEGIPDSLSSFKELQNALVNGVALNIIIQVGLFWLHPNFSAIGFIVGATFDKAAEYLLKRVNNVYNAHQTMLEQILLFAGGGVVAILTMPTSLVIAAIYHSIQLGRSFYQNCEKRYPHLFFPESSNTTEQLKESIVSVGKKLGTLSTDGNN